MEVVLTKGSRGDLVVRLQKALNLIPDGIFGKLTEEAVKAFQKANGLTPDGVVGENTWAKLFNINVSSSEVLTGKKATRRIDRIFVHCTAGNQTTTTVNSLNTEFKAKGWKTGGYHYVIFPDGRVVEMENEDKIANGVKGYNKSSIHISWVGGYNSVDNRTQKQKDSIIKVLKELRKKYPSAKILGHRDISPDKNNNGIIDPWERIKDCPCFDVLKEYKNI